MQAVSTPSSLSPRQFALWALATLFTSGLMTYVVTWLLNQRKYRAEILNVSAGSVKIQAEARQIDATTVMELVERVRELVEINSQLQDELNETGRQRDNCEFELKREQEAREQLQIQNALREHFISELEAANKLGLTFREFSLKQKLDKEKAG